MICRLLTTRKTKVCHTQSDGQLYVGYWPLARLRFVRFVLVWFCLFPLPLVVWEGLLFVIVALPGLFSYLFLFFFFYVLPCVILFLCFSVLLALRFPAWGRERANLNAFRTFFRFVFVWFCRFPLPLGVWKGLRFVIVALPGLFSYRSFLH